MSFVTAGATDVTQQFSLQLAVDGTAATGLTITDLDLSYTRTREALPAKVDATALAAVDSAHADYKAIELDATNRPGLYRIDWPDAAFAAGVDHVILTVKAATIYTAHKEVQLISPTRGLAGTALPDAAADAAGGLPVSDAGGLDLDTILNGAVPDSIPADGSLPTMRQALYMLVQFMLERAVSGTTVTVRKADGSTPLFTLTTNDADAPTTITRAT